MLNLKTAREILKVCDSKEKIKFKFLEHYGCQKAIRLIKRDYIRSDQGQRGMQSDYRLTYSCDNCGELFVRNESDKTDLICPKCGYQKTYTIRGFEHKHIDDSYNNYSHVLSNAGNVISPCTVSTEKVWYNEVLYHVLRKFHFTLANGEINDIRMAKCIIAGECKVDGCILLREAIDGQLKRASSQYVQSWFTDYKWREIPCDNILPNEKEYDQVYELVKEVAEKYKKASCYYAPEIAKARDYALMYPVNQNPIMQNDDECMEVHENYFVHRRFHENREISRWIYSYKDKTSVVLEFANEDWRVVDEGEPSRYNDSVLLHYRKELEKGFVGRLGLYLLFDYNEDIFIAAERSRGISYLVGLFSYPIIESMVKVGLSHLMDCVRAGQITVDNTKKRLWQRLGISKHNYQLLFDKRVRDDDFRWLKEINPYDPHADAESFYKVISKEVEIEHRNALNIMFMHKLTLKQIVEYMSDIKEKQGIESTEACGIWEDYLDMYKRYYGFEPKSREKRYPDSLKKAHDLISMHLQKKDDQKESRNFKMVSERWKKLVYKDEKFIISLPNSSEDLSRESDILGHCVHSYTYRVLNGSCLILFLRRSEKPDMPFFTMEFDCKNQLVQIRGKGNRKIEDISDSHNELRDDLISFLKKWGKKNRITTGYEAPIGVAA